MKLVLICGIALAALPVMAFAADEPSAEYTKLVSCAAFFEIEEADEKAKSGDTMSAMMLGAMAGDLQERAEEKGKTEDRDAADVKADTGKAKAVIEQELQTRTGDKKAAYYEMVADLCYDLSGE